MQHEVTDRFRILAYFEGNRSSLLHLCAEIFGWGGARPRFRRGAIASACTNIEPCLCSISYKPSGGERPLDNLSQACSALSGIRDAFAVSHLYSTYKSCYYKTPGAKPPETEAF